MAILNRPKKEVLTAVFEIASSSIGGILFLHHPEKLPEILTTLRLPTAFYPDLNFQKIQRSLHKTFEQVIAGLKKQMPLNRKIPDLAIIVFSSPYYVSQSKIIKLPELKPFKITDKFLKNLIADETLSFEKKWQGAKIMEIEKMEANSKNSEFPIYISLGMKPILDKLQECVSHSFGEIPVCFQSFPFVVFLGLKTVMDMSEDVLLIDIGGETTDLILIKNGILEETISFPLGENFLIRKIANMFHFPLEESFSLLRRYARGDLAVASHKKIQKIIEEAALKWCWFFENSFKESPDNPQNLLFIGGEGALAFKNFSPCVKNKPFKSRFLFAEALKNHFDFRRGFNQDKDISLMLSALFADKLFLEK